MNPPNHDPLFKEIFTGDDLDRLRQSSLAGGLAVVRRRRLVHRATRLAGASTLALLLGLTLLLRRDAIPGGPSAPVVALSPAPAAAPAAGSNLKIISDDQLLAHFPNQQVALIGAPGHQQLFVFDDNGVEHSP